MTPLPDNKEKGTDLELSEGSATCTIGADVNAASQAPVLAKSFNLFSACATGITTGNAWAVLGGGIVCICLLSPLASLLTNLGCIALQWRSSGSDI